MTTTVKLLAYEIKGLKLNSQCPASGSKPARQFNNALHATIRANVLNLKNAGLSMKSEFILKEFIDMGFEPIVTFVARADRFAPDSLAWNDHAGWLYAIVSNQTVMYVGLTTNVLRTRMDHYRYSVGSQGKRVNALIIAELCAGKMVQMYGLKIADDVERSIEELRLRREYSLPWNLV